MRNLTLPELQLMQELVENYNPKDEFVNIFTADEETKESLLSQIKMAIRTKKLEQAITERWETLTRPYSKPNGVHPTFVIGPVINSMVAHRDGLD